MIARLLAISYCVASAKPGSLLSRSPGMSDRPEKWGIPVFDRLQFPVALRHHAELADPQRVQVEIGVAPRARIRFDRMVLAGPELVQNGRVEDVDPLSGPGRGIHPVSLGEVRIGGRLRTRSPGPPASARTPCHSPRSCGRRARSTGSIGRWWARLPHIVVQRVRPVEHGQRLETR